MSFPTFQQKFIVFYSTTGMRERLFDNEIEANDFALTVNGSVAPITVKTMPHRNAAQSRKYNNELKRIKTFGY